jgi:catechol 2,3-dioxygenase-like lactoylglutathione lyase family enzyme
MHRAVLFYGEVLGMTLVDTNPWWTSLECGGVRIGLHGEGPGEQPPVPHVPRDSHGAHAGGTLTLRSSDIVADRARLLKHGVKILGDIDEAWGKLVVFEDSEGNVLKLMQPA